MITFRKAKEEDIDAIRSIAYATWPNTYNELVGVEQVNYMLDLMYNKGELLSQFQQGVVFLIGEIDREACAFAGFSKLEDSASVYKLHKLYALPHTQGKGMGKILINEVVSQIRRAKGTHLLLNVNKANKALMFYEHCGFKIKEAVTLDIGNGYVMDDYVMELELPQSKL